MNAAMRKVLHILWICHAAEINLNIVPAIINAPTEVMLLCYNN